jgi:hypothetical protein
MPVPLADVPEPGVEETDEDVQLKPQANLVTRPARKPAKSRKAAAAAAAAPPPPSVPDPGIVAPPPVPAEVPPPAVQAAEARDEDGPVHRRLIRATLPRPEGQQPTRPIPEFTLRQPPRAQRAGAGHRFGGFNKHAGSRPGAQGGRSHAHGSHRHGLSTHGVSDAHGRHKGNHARGNRPKKAR